MSTTLEKSTAITESPLPPKTPSSVKWWGRLRGRRTAILRLRRKLLVASTSEQAAWRAVFREHTPEACLLWINLSAWTYRPKKAAGGAGTEHQKHWPFITWAYQEPAIREIWAAIDEGHDLLGEKSRDMGMTWSILVVFVWFGQFVPGTEFGVSSWKEDFVYKRGSADTLFWKLEYLVARQLPWMVPPYRINEMILVFEETGSTITGETANPDMFRSGRKKALFPDEFASMPYQEEFDTATADVTDCRIFNSTPKGMGTHFAKIRFGGHIRILTLHWQKHPEKRKGLYTAYPGGGLRLLDPDYTYPADGCFLNPVTKKYHGFVLDGKVRSPWYDFEEWRRGSKKAVAQELDIDYLASGEAFFDLDVLQAIRNSGQLRPCDTRGNLQFEVKTLTVGHSYRVMPATFSESARGALQLWTPLDGGRPSQNDHYVAFCDISNGQGASNSVCRVASVGRREVVGVWASPDYSPSDFARVCVALWRWFGGDTHDVYAGWEANGPGGIFGLEVMRLGYWSILGNPDLMTVTETERDRKSFGWYSTGGDKGSKSLLLEDLRARLARGEIIEHDERCITEMEQYIRYTNGTPGPSRLIDDPEGGRSQHGDHVISLAGILKCLDEQPKIKARPKIIPWGTPEYFAAQERRSRERLASVGY